MTRQKKKHVLQLRMKHASQIHDHDHSEDAWPTLLKKHERQKLMLEEMDQTIQTDTTHFNYKTPAKANQLTLVTFQNG